jgi:hypothetical protein
VSELLGRAVWALAPYAPEAPFRLYPGPGERPPVIVGAVEPLRAALKAGGDPEVTVLTTTKLRPVLVVAVATDTTYDPGLLVLRMLSFAKLNDTEQAEIRAGADPRYFHLLPGSFPDLPHENAAIVSTLTRVAATAVEDNPLGKLNADELRVVHERIATYFQLDLGTMVKRLVTERTQNP